MVEEIDDGGAQTGDSARRWMWIAGIGGSAALIVIILAVRKRKNIDETETE